MKFQTHMNGLLYSNFPNRTKTTLKCSNDKMKDCYRLVESDFFYFHFFFKTFFDLISSLFACQIGCQIKF